MTDRLSLKRIMVFLLMVMILAVTSPASGDEMLALYGLKGYAYTYSPVPSDGFHLQIGAMYSIFHDGNPFHDDNLNCRDGYIWAAPLSLTYGDGDWWEASLATHWESWKNTDYDVDENGLGDLFAGGKFRALAQEKGMPLDVALMGYLLIPTGNREDSIGDLYLYNPASDDDFSYGVNLLLGRQLRSFYLAATIGTNYVDTDIEHIRDNTFFLGLTMEYQVCETLSTYVEFISNENKNKRKYPLGHPCRDEDANEDIREIGIGGMWVKGPWGIRLHAGFGLTPTSPDIRVMTSVNRSFAD